METSGLRHMPNPYKQLRPMGTDPCESTAAAMAVEPTLFGTARATRECLIGSLDRLRQIDGALHNLPGVGGECSPPKDVPIDDLHTIIEDCNSLAHRIAETVHEIGNKVGQ